MLSPVAKMSSADERGICFATPHFPQRMNSPRRRTCSRRSVPGMHFLEAAHTAADFFQHVWISCGVGLIGIVGARATRQARALMESQYAAERRMLEQEVWKRDRRRMELAQGGNRDWQQVLVDADDNYVVTDNSSPHFVSVDDEFTSFDRILNASAEQRQHNAHPLPPSPDQFLDALDDAFSTDKWELDKS